MSNIPIYDPEVSGKPEDRNERTGVLGTHGFAMVIGAVIGIAAFAVFGGAIGGIIGAVLLAVLGAGAGAVAGRAAAKALRPSAADRLQQERLSTMPVIKDE